jgi:lysophospholipase L1-like esterase
MWMWGLALILAGLPVAGAGVRLALERPRPINLAGMLLAPLGLALALAGVGRALSPSFFGGAARGSGRLRIMPAGDSLTRGYGAVPGHDSGGYRGPLWAKLAARSSLGVDFVGTARGGPFAIDRDHESWDGITVDGLAARLHADLATEAPDVILLHIGTNDLVKGATPDVAAGRLAALVDGITTRAPRVEVLVAAILGVRPGNQAGVPPDAVAELNSRIRALVAARAARGDRVRLVDIFGRVGRAPGDFVDDGLHLGERAYYQMADLWLEALRPLLR